LTLTAGSRLGAYEIVTLLGAGGMGEVYRARDTKLGREVALKILPSTLTSDPDRVARFRREAQVLASLNHPHIAQIHGLDEAGSSQFLVLELVDGESLDKRIARGPIPLDEALAIAGEIAEALEAAHDKGIIHRDLKPANIALTRDGHVKVLDFGLAKASEAVGLGSFEVTNSPTIVSPLTTGVGVILGTAAYMSPEQARGKAVDRRSDIWAFGCVVYEMLAGRRLFDGDSVADVIGAIVHKEPSWAALPHETAPRLRRLLRRCLAKDLQKRLRNAGDARLELDRDPDEDTAPSPRRAHSISPALVAGVIASVAAAVWVGWFAARRSEVGSPQLEKYSVSLPADTALDLNSLWSSLAISRDGRTILYVTLLQGERRIVLRRADDLNPRILSGTNGTWEAFLSPDGAWVGFLAGDRLKKIAVTGGQPAVIADAANYNCGVWADDGTIYLGGRAGLAKVAPDGTLTTLLKPSHGEGELSHPDLLPDGSLLFTIKPNDVSSFDEARIAVLTPKGERRIVLEGGASARYAPTGHIVFARSGQILAVPFDTARLATTGPPVAVVNGGAFDPNTSIASYAISRTGVLAYVPGGALARRRSIAWLDRSGALTPIPAEPRTYAEPSISPDERQIALTIRAANDDVWIYDLARGSFSRLTFPHGNSQVPVWSADGSRVVYSLDRDGVRSLVSRSADGHGAEEPLTPAEYFQTGGSPSSDGKLFAYEEDRPETGADIFVARLDRHDAPVAFMATRVNERAPKFSPDGRWIAYESDETGRFEVFVAAYPGPGRKWQVSDSGGAFPMWRRDGREIVYRNRDLLMSVKVSGQSGLETDRPQQLLKLPPYTGYVAMTPSANRFLVSYGDGTDAKANELNVVLNWFNDLKSIAAGR
jgi:serine/threonine-protein kinase